MIDPSIVHRPSIVADDLGLDHVPPIAMSFQPPDPCTGGLVGFRQAPEAQNEQNEAAR